MEEMQVALRKDGKRKWSVEQRAGRVIILWQESWGCIYTRQHSKVICNLCTGT